MITKEDYAIFLRYARSLIFNSTQLKTHEDIVHDVVLDGLVKNHSKRYMMFNIRMGVIGRNRGKKETTDDMPRLIQQPDVFERFEVADFLKQIDRIEIYKWGCTDGSKIDSDKTTKAKEIVRMTYEGYHINEISDSVKMDKRAVHDLRRKAIKKVKI